MKARGPWELRGAFWRETVAMAEEQRPDVMIRGTGLPGLHGIEVEKRCAAKHGAHARR